MKHATESLCAFNDFKETLQQDAFRNIKKNIIALYPISIWATNLFLLVFELLMQVLHWRFMLQNIYSNFSPLLCSNKFCVNERLIVGLLFCHSNQRCFTSQMLFCNACLSPLAAYRNIFCVSHVITRWCCMYRISKNILKHHIVIIIIFVWHNSWQSASIYNNM